MAEADRSDDDQDYQLIKYMVYPYKCRVCGERFNKQCEFKKHCEEKNHSCFHCGSTFKGREPFMDHILQHCNTVADCLEELEIVPYFCGSCGGPFVSEAEVMIHQQNCATPRRKRRVPLSFDNMKMIPKRTKYNPM